MADLFVSYAREDQARVAALVALLEGEGRSVFWDRNIPPGGTWRSHIGRELEQARCVVVAWSEHSIRSEWVIEEAEEAKERGILIPVFLDTVQPPRGFRGIQAADLSGWQKGRNSPAAAAFLIAVAKVLDAPPDDGPRERRRDGASPGPVTAVDVQWLSRLRRWLIVGGLGAVAVLMVAAFLMWPASWSDKARPTSGQPVTSSSGVGRNELLDPEKRQSPSAFKAIASLEANVAGLAADIIQSQRSEGELSIRMMLRNVGHEIVVLHARGKDAIYVAAEGKKYYLIQDKDGTPLAAGPGTYVEPIVLLTGKIWIWWGKFVAPPKGTTYVSYYTPWTLPLDKLPITD
jgi:TIR domain